MAENVSDFGFAYIDADHAVITNPSVAFQLDGQQTAELPAFDDVTQRGAVRQVSMHLTITEDVPQQGPQTYRMATDVRLRNVQ